MAKPGRDAGAANPEGMPSDPDASEVAMPETVKFDLLGDRRLVFDDEGVTHITKEMYAVPLPGYLAIATVVTDRPIRYRDIRRVEPIRRRQWWALALGAIFAPLGLFWMANEVGNWGPFGFGVVCLLLLGLFPLWLFFRGRTYLAIASEREVIVLPMDRKKKQVRRALVLLKRSVPPEARWDVGEI